MSNTDTKTTAVENPAAVSGPQYDATSLTAEAKTELSNAVITQQTGVLNPVEYEQMRRMSKDYYASNVFPESYKTADQIMMAMVMGRSMGMTPHESVVNGYFIKGAYNVFGKAVPAAIRRHGWTFYFKDETPESCTVVIKHTKSGEIIEDTFTYADAVASGFTKDNYGKEKMAWRSGSNRKRKLRYGVLSQAVHTYIPDVLGAVGGIAEYTEDYVQSEYQDKDELEKQRKERIAKAAEERKAMMEAEHQPIVVDPIEGEIEEAAREQA